MSRSYRRKASTGVAGSLVAALLALAVLSSFWAVSAEGGEIELADGGLAVQNRNSPVGDVDLPWYDERRDEVTPVGIDEGKPSSANYRDSSWLPAPPPQNRPRVVTGGGGGGGSGISVASSQVVSNLVSVLLWLLIGAVCVALMIWLAWLVLSQRRRADDQALLDFGSDVTLDPARVADLPFEVKQNRGDFLALAREAHEQGRLREATIYLFSYLLLKLDKHHWIRLTRSKTNRTYLRELSGAPDLQAILQPVVVMFEDVFFGGIALGPQDFSACWNRLDQFHQLVERQERS